MDVEWFYVDSSGSQAGPVSIAELKQAWVSKQLTDASLVWNANLSGWQAVEATPDLKRQLPSAAAPAQQPSAAAAPALAPRPVGVNLGGPAGLGASIASAAAGLKKGQPLPSFERCWVARPLVPLAVR